MKKFKFTLYRRGEKPIMKCFYFFDGDPQRISARFRTLFGDNIVVRFEDRSVIIRSGRPEFSPYSFRSPFPYITDFQIWKGVNNYRYEIIFAHHGKMVRGDYSSRELKKWMYDLSLDAEKYWRIIKEVLKQNEIKDPRFIGKQSFNHYLNSRTCKK